MISLSEKFCSEKKHEAIIKKMMKEKVRHEKKEKKRKE